MPKSKRCSIGSHLHSEDRLAALNALLSQELATRAQVEKERVEMEHHLRAMRERFESGFLNAPIGMAVVDMNGAWLQVNAALCRIIGYPESDLKATTLDAITHPEDVGIDQDDLQQLLAGRIRSY